MIKQIKHTGIIIVSLFLLNSCAKKETISNSDEQVGISKVVFFPSIAINGEQLIILNQGDTYTEEGASAVLNDEETEFTTVGTVDTNTPGIYELTYEAANEQGFTVSDFRTVVVIGNDVAANDYSGTYARWTVNATTGVFGPNGQTSTWTKTGDGVYSIENPGGAAGLTVVGVNFTGNQVAVPMQSTDVGPFKSTIGTYDATATPAFYEWAIVNGTYGPALRTFKKQ